MAWFSSHNEIRYLGIDLGGSGVKIVECRSEKGVPRLTNYAFSQEPLETIGQRDIRDTPQECAVLIRDVLHTMHGSATKTVASLPTFSVFSSVITVQGGDKAAIGAEVQEKAKRIIPLPIEEMVVDWKIITQALTQPTPSTSGTSGKEVINENPQKTARVLLTAAQRKLVSRYIQIFKLAGLELISLETEAFALMRSLLGNDRSPVMVVDMGAVTADLSIIKDLTPVLDRSLDMGGMHLTRRLSEVLSVNIAHAEEVKKDLGLSLKGAQSPALTTLKEMLNPVIHEIRYTANLYGSQVQKIILTGGSAFLPGLGSYLQEMLNVRVIIGNPWSHMTYPKNLEPVLQQIGPRLSVAAGLAMREII